MKEFVNKILNSKSFKVAMINLVFSNTILTSADYLRLSKDLRELNQETNTKPEKIQLKKAS